MQLFTSYFNFNNPQILHCEQWFLQAGRYASMGKKPVQASVCFFDRAAFQRTISKFKSEKKNKFRRCLFTLSIKRKIRHLHVVVVQKWQRNAKIKAWCTCKVVVLLIKPIVLLKFSLPSCRWIFVVITWTRMLDGKANGCSQWFLSLRSVASGLEKPLLAGYPNPNTPANFSALKIIELRTPN